MKYLIFGTLALLLLLSQTTQAQEWVELDPEEVENSDSRVVRDLLDVAVGYVSQKGKFESTKAPLPGDYYIVDEDTVKYERRNTSTVTYYRYNFLLTEKDGPSAVRANVTISYNPSNSNFIVTNYRYNVDSDGNEGQNEEVTENDSDVETTLIDTRTLTGDSDLAKILSETFDDQVSDKIAGYNIPEANYTISHIYAAYRVQFDGVEDVNEEGEVTEEVEDDGGIWPSQGYRYYDIWVKFKSSEGNYYLMLINIHYVKDKETGEFGPEIFSTDGFLRLDWVDESLYPE